MPSPTVARPQTKPAGHASMSPSQQRSGPAVERDVTPQRDIGNQAVLRHLAQQRASLAVANAVLQRKLAIGAIDDPLEHEADRVAEQVMHSPARPAGGSGIVQRTCAACEDDGIEAPGLVHDVLRSPGHPLDPATRALMEPRLDDDFSRVRVHTDSRAADSARAVNALAYTVGSDLVFAEGRYAPASQAGQRLLAHELTHVVQQAGGAEARLRRQMVTRRSGDTVGPLGAVNVREDVLSVMDRLHLIGVLPDADYATEHAAVVIITGGAFVPETQFPKTIAAITSNEVEQLPAWVAEKILALRLGGDVGNTMANGAADVALVQTRLRALNLLSDSDFAAETRAAAIPKTLAAIKALRVAYVSGTLGWQPVRMGEWSAPDESQFGGDRFGGQTFEFHTTLPTFDPAADAAGASVDRDKPLSVFVPTEVTAPKSAGKPAATSTKVMVFFSPGDVIGATAGNAVNTHGLRAAADGTDWVVISVPGISGTPVDGWVAITNAAISFCLDRAGLPATLGTVRLVSHSRGAQGLKHTLSAKTLTATVDKVTILDESTAFGPGNNQAGNLAPLIKNAAPKTPGDPGITMAPGGGGVSYQVVAQPLAGTQAAAIAPACARCIGYSRLIRDAIQDADVSRDLFGPAPATPSAATPDWTGIWPQLLTLPPRGQFSTRSPTPAGHTDITGFCNDPKNSALIAAMDARVMAGWAEQQKPRPAWNVKVFQVSPKAFCDAHHLGLTNFSPVIDAHHNFVAEIAWELFT